MSSKARVYDDKTIITNYLVNHYTEDGFDPQDIIRKKLIRETVSEIFALQYFPEDTASVKWYKDAIINILGRMEKRLQEISSQSPQAHAA